MFAWAVAVAVVERESVLTPRRVKQAIAGAQTLPQFGCGGVQVLSHSTMSPTTKSHRNLKVNVPRHDSQRIGPLLTASVETIAHQQRVRVDIRQTALEPTSALAQAIVR